MCIICAKPRGIEIPSDETFAECFLSNPDGAGIAYSYNNKVHISKGLQTIKDFNEKLKEIKKIIDTKEQGMLFHFRIGTHGSKNSPIHTHPFPVVSEYETMEKLEGDYDSVVAHNGILTIPRLIGESGRTYEVGKTNGPSDTMEMISKILVPMSNIPNWLKEESHYIILNKILGTNKVVMMNKDGEIIFINGDFIKDDGLFYSNSGYKIYPKTKYINTGSSNDGDTEWNDYKKEAVEKYIEEYTIAAQERESSLYEKWADDPESGHNLVLKSKMLTWYKPINICMTPMAKGKKYTLIYIHDPRIPIYVDNEGKCLYIIDEKTGDLEFIGYSKDSFGVSDKFIYNKIVFNYYYDFRKTSFGLRISPKIDNSKQWPIDQRPLVYNGKVIETIKEMVSCVKDKETTTKKKEPAKLITIKTSKRPTITDKRYRKESERPLLDFKRNFKTYSEEWD